MLYAYLIRSNGIAILMSLCIIHIVYLRRIHLQSLVAYIVPYAVFALGAVLVRYGLDSAGGEGHIALLIESISLKSITRNILYYAGIWGDFFALPNFLHFFPSILESKYAFLIPNPLALVLWGGCAYILVLGFVQVYKQEIFIGLFVGISLVILILWPALQGVRFVFCTLPFMAIWIAYGAREVSLQHPKLIRICIALVLSYFVLKDCYHIASRHTALPAPIQALKTPESIQAFSLESKRAYEAIGAITKPSDIVVFFKPRVLYLATSRLSYSTSKLERLDKAQYLLESSFAPLFDQARLRHLPIVYASKHFTLYRLQ